jgi:hypothetical protein
MLICSRDPSKGPIFRRGALTGHPDAARGVAGMPEDIVLSPHRFRIGDSVHFTSGMFGRGGANGVYEVVRLLPTDGDEQQYRIKSMTEPHERVAKQSQLERTA